MDAQFKKGILDICVLSILEKKEIYGYGLKVEMSQIMDVNENTLYPLLRRLEKDGDLETYSHVSNQGRSRKYYRITNQGKEHLELLRQDWLEFRTVANKMILGDDKNE